MGGYDTMTVITLVAVEHEGQAYPAGAVVTVPAGTAVRWLVKKQATAAPKDVKPTPAPAVAVPPTIESEAPPPPAKSSRQRPTLPTGVPKYRRRDVEPEE